MPMLGDVFLDTVYTENPTGSVKVTEHPIETKENIIDHIEKKAVTMKISGVIAGPDAAQRRIKLESYMNSGKLLKFVYLNILDNMIIENFNPNYDVDISDGFKYDINLVQVRLAKVASVANLPKAIKRQVAPVKKKGLQQKKTKVKKGATAKTNKIEKAKKETKASKPSKTTDFKTVLDKVNNR